MKSLLSDFIEAGSLAWDLLSNKSYREGEDRLTKEGLRQLKEESKQVELEGQAQAL